MPCKPKRGNYGVYAKEKGKKRFKKVKELPSKPRAHKYANSIKRYYKDVEVRKVQ